MSEEKDPIQGIVRQVDYGDFTEYQVRCLVADYCRDITTGGCGWGVSFRNWVESRGIARPGKLFQLFRLPNDQGQALADTTPNTVE